MGERLLYGVVCATITPMLEDGSVDYDSVKTLVSYLTEKGIHSLYVNGTNGESLSLSFEERVKLAEVYKKNTTDAIRFYVQCGAQSAEESYRHVRHAKEIKADGAGLMTPVFFPADDPAMENYYSSILEEIGEFPTYIYNIASRTGNDVKPETVSKLSRKYPALKGIKYSNADLIRLNDYRTCAPGRQVDVLIGCDYLALACMSIGGKGWVSGPCAIFPELHVQLYKAIGNGDMEKARDLQDKLTSVMKSIAGIPEIPAIKYILYKKGIIAADTCRLPFRKLTEDEKERLNRVYESYEKLLESIS